MNKALMVLGGGVLLYYLYGQQKTAATPTPASTPAAATPPAQSPGPSLPGPAVNPSASQRAAIVAYINGSGVSSTFVYGQQTPDTWNWYAMQTFPNWTAPDPALLYPGEPNVHTKTYTFDDWFKRIAPYLPTTGMSGVQESWWPRSKYVGPGGWLA